MNRPAVNAVSIALLLAIALLAAVIAVELLPANTADADLSADVAATDIERPLASGQRFIAPDIGDFAQVLQHPLFYPDRKLPAEPEPAPLTAAPRLPLRLTLEGIAITSDSRVAVLRNKGNNELLQLAEGMSHDGWLLERLDSNTATFRRGAETSELALDPNGRR